MLAAQHAATLSRLREQLQKRQASPRQYLATLRTGLPALDSLLPGGGFPRGHVLELCGTPSSGRTSLALRAAASATREQRLAAFVDSQGELFPPAAAALGVDLSRVLWVRPKTPREGVWSGLQLVRSGAFACVALDLSHPRLSMKPAEGKSLVDAAAQSGVALLLLTSPEAPGDSFIRLHVSPCGPSEIQVEIIRSRQGGLGNRARIPWEALYPGLELATFRQVPPFGWDETRAPLPPNAKQHPVSTLRNGAIGFYASRPGRDITMPPLAQALGVGG